MSGYHDPQKPPYIDEAVLGNTVLNWAFDTVTPEDPGPVVAPLPHNRPPVHRQQYAHHPGMPPPAPSGFVRQPAAYQHAPPRPAHRPPPVYPPSVPPMTSLPPPPPPPFRAPPHGGPPHGAPPHGAPPHGAPPHGAPPHAAQTHGAPTHSAPIHGAPTHAFPPHAAPQSTFSSSAPIPARAPTNRPSAVAPSSNQNSTCQYCGKSYSRPDYLSTHIAGKHSGRKMWNCKICGKEYKWRSSLSHHQKTAHQRPEGTHHASSPHVQLKPPHIRRERQH